jgi:hypothetical protein
LTGRLTVLESGAPDGISQVSDYHIEWSNIGCGQLTARNAGGKVLWQTILGESFVAAAQAEEMDQLS